MEIAGDDISVEKGDWKFDGSVAEKFDEHVLKSIPLYTEAHQIVCNLTDYFLPTHSLVFELGCSTGTLLCKIANHNKHKKAVKYIGIDQEQKMIELANYKRNTVDQILVDDIEFICENINEYSLQQNNMVICFYVVQFIHPSLRQQLINKIYRNLKWGGAFVLFEKVRGSDARFQDVLTGLYHDYKKLQGYSEEEIFNKSLSLRGVMEPFSRQGNVDMLRRAGFVDIESVFKYLCFEGFLAIK